MATVIETENTRAISRLTQAIAELTAAFQVEVSYRQAAVAAALAEARAYADTVSAQQYVLPPAAAGTLGGVKPDGVTVTVDPDGTVRSHVDAEALPYASSATYGVVKVDGTTVVARNGVLTAVASSVSWNDVTDKPGADSALDGESENPVQNRVVTEAMDARPTETRVETGWWGGWVYVGVPQGLSVVDNSHSAGTGWTLTLSNGLTADAEGDGDAGLLSWTFAPPSGDPFSVTAARPRFAGPVPRYVSQLVNDLGFVVTSDILSGGKVRSDLLPSYVDDVLEYGSTFDFPASGETGKIYVATGTNRTYRWSGSQYVEVASPPTVDSALSETSANPVQNKVVTEAVNARPTKEQIEAGWWSKWTVLRVYDSTTEDVTSLVDQPEFYAEESTWLVNCLSDDGEHPNPSGDESSTALDWPSQSGARYTATRHRVAAPVPTKTSDLVNDGPDGKHPFLTSHQTWSDVKPSGGIPKTDLASAVQTSLGKADTAVQPSGIAAKMPMYDLGASPATLTTWAVPESWFPIVWTDETSDGTVATHTISDALGVVLDDDGSQIALNDALTGNSLIFFDSSTGEYDSAGFYQSLTIGDLPSSQITSLSLDTKTTLTVAPYTVATYTAASTAEAFEIAVGALPAGVTGKARDCILVIDCTATGAVAPTVTWGTHFHPRTDTATDLAIVEAGKRTVFYISEYAPGEFAVGGWVETAGGSGT